MMGSNDSLNSYLKIGEAADVTKLSTKTIRRALDSVTHPLRHYRIGRRVIILRRDLDSWVESHRAVPLPASRFESIPVSRSVQEILARLHGTPAAPAAGK